MKKRVKNILFTILVIGIWQVSSAFAGATLTVNSANFGNVCDNQLSLSEAVTIAREGVLGRNLTTGEKNQISGAQFVISPDPPSCPDAVWVYLDYVGPYYADDIVFSNNVGTLNGAVFLGRNDDIDGLKPNGQKVILDGTGVGPANVSGVQNYYLFQTTGSQIRNLVIQNFSGNGVYLSQSDGAIIEGLEITSNGNNGIVLDHGLGTNAKNSRNTRIGGDQPQHRNLIYGNGTNGIRIISLQNLDRFPDQNIVIKNNYIGTGNGTSDNGNNGDGIRLENAFGVTIGDTTGATRNIISGNNNDGIGIRGAKAVSNTIIGNFIGVDITGAAALGNSQSGIALLQGAGSGADFISSSANKIGLPNLGNTIGANNFGVFVADANTSNNWIRGNYIGVNTGGNTDVGNISDGVFFAGGTFDNIVGGTNTNEGNLIAFNRNGIRADGGIRNSFRRNRMFGNDLLGIDLAPVGVTPNDLGDGDTGPNNLQNFPVITYVNAQNGTTTIQGTFNSTANQTYTLEFFGNTAADSTGYGEGRNFIGSTTVTTDASGNATFNAPFSVNISSVGSFITSTATDSNGNTSEFSQARNICADLILSPALVNMTSAGGASNFTVVRSVGCGYTAQSNASWITLGSTSMGTVNFTVAANPGSQRSGTITISYNNGTGNTTQTFTVNQANGCSFSLNPTSVNVPAAGDSVLFTINASDSSCGWTITSNTSWITLGITSGSGTTQVLVGVNANSGFARSGTITAAGQTFTVNQAGTNCFTLNSTSQNFAASGGSGIVSFSASNSFCSWTASSNSSWITITGATSGLGGGNTSFSVAANNGPARTGTITVAGQLFTVTQASGCAFTLTPTNVNIAASGGNSSFTVNASNSACTWTATENSPWLSITSGASGTGNGTVNFSVAANSGAARSGTITAGGQTFTINQEAACSYNLSPSLVNTGAFGLTANFQIHTTAGCPWIAFSNVPWISANASGSGFGVVNYTVEPNTGGQRTGTITAGGATLTIIQASGRRMAFDYDGDSRTDISIFRPALGEWWYLRSSDGNNRAFQFGIASDKIAPADYTGDMRADIAFFRPSDGNWYVLRSENFTFYAFPFGTAGDTPVPADYDGDLKADAAVFRSSNQTWYIQKSSGGTDIISFGAAGDKPVPADYDGDGKADIAIYRPNGASGAEWWNRRSSNGSVFATVFGTQIDKPVQGDYTGDGKADIAFFRPSNGNWFILRSEDLTFFAFPFGANGDIPVAGDYDGDGKFDAGVFRPSNSTWYVQRSTAGILIQTFGISGDLPTPSAFVP